MRMLTRTFFTVVLAIVIVALGSRFLSVLNNVPNAANRGQETIEGLWELYDEPGSVFDYMIYQNGRRIPFILTGGEVYVGKHVRVIVRYVDEGPEFRVVSIQVLE